jgi:hypothetical protein
MESSTARAHSSLVPARKSTVSGKMAKESDGSVEENRIDNIPNYL